RRFYAGWREHLAFVTPDTVVRWHRQGWRLFWRWKSRSRGGRPYLSPEGGGSRPRSRATARSRERVAGSVQPRRRSAESTGGISPPAAHRTVHTPLGVHGS